jgi:cytosine/adenosine deaminase-related metal-dependent hydrolase
VCACQSRRGAPAHSTTIGGANALQRDDLGHLAPGCKADLVLVDLADVNMLPARDPLRSLIYTAAERVLFAGETQKTLETDCYSISA